MMGGARHAGGRPRKPLDVRELKRLLDDGRSLRQIARDLRCGYGTVYRAAQAFRSAGDPRLTEVIQNPAA